MKFIVTASLLSAIILAGCKEDPEQAANRLFVSSIPLWEKYQTLSPTEESQAQERLDLLRTIDKNLARIVADFPESSLAVELSSTGMLKQLVRADIQWETHKTEREVLCAKTGNVKSCALSEALQLAESVSDPEKRDRTLGRIAAAQAGSGDIDGALKTAERITSESSRLEAFALLRAASNDLTEAFKIASRVADVSERDRLLGEIASNRLDSEDVQGAMQAAERIADERWRYALLSAALAASGKFPEALKTAEQIKNEIWRDGAFHEIAAAQAETGDIAGAMLTGEKIEGIFGRDEVMGTIAAAQARSGDMSGASATVFELLEGDLAIDSALQKVTAAQTAAGDLSGAMVTAWSIADESRRFSAIALVEASSGQVAKAMETVERIADDSTRREAYIGLVMAQTASKDFVGALQAARSIADPTWRGGAMLWILKESGG